MITGNDSRRLIELAFDYVLAETEQQAQQAREQATSLAAEKTTFNIWLELVDYIEEWNSNSGHEYPITRAGALQFFLIRQADEPPSQAGVQ